PLGNSHDGILVRSSFNVIGGTAANARNVISANGLNVIKMANDSAQAHDNLIQQNLIGTDISGISLLGNGGDGVRLTASFDDTISNNTIAGNRGRGVKITDSGTINIAVLGSSIFANGSLGMDLNGD